MRLQDILRWITLSGIFALPFLVFVVVDNTFFPYVFGKNIFFRVLVEILFASWVGLALLNRDYRPQITPVFVALSAFVCVVLLADVLGANPFKSFWSNFERMEGFVTIFHLYLYYIVASVLFRTESVALWFWRVCLGTSFFVTLNTVVQFLTTEKNRLDSTLGNPIYLAVYALFHIFIALFLIARRGASRNEQIIYALTVPFLLWLLYATATRGAIIGVFAGLFLASIGIAFTLRSHKRLQITAGVIVVTLLIGVVGFFMARESVFVQNNLALKRIANISLSEGSVYARTVIWGIAWEGFKDRPMLGWGQENFNLAFNFNYDPRMYDQESWFDRAHNVVFNWLVTAGVLGLLAYISIFLALLWMLYQAQRITVTQKWLVVGLLVAYGFHNLTVFDQIISYILFFSVLAWVSTLQNKEYIVLGTYKEIENKILVAVSVGIVSITAIYFINVEPWKTNTVFISGLQDLQLAAYYAGQEDVEHANMFAEQGLNTLIKAGNRSTYGVQEVHELITQRAESLIQTDWMSEELKNAWYEQGVLAMRSEMELSPRDARFPSFLAPLHAARGEYELEKEMLELALERIPGRQVLIVSLAANAQKLGNNDEVLPLLREAYMLEKNFQEVATLYAIRLIIEGEVETFDTEFGDSSYVGSDARVLSTLVQAGLHERAENAWERAYRASKEERVLFLLAAVYDQFGDVTRIRVSIERAMELEPSARVKGEEVLEILDNLQ